VKRRVLRRLLPELLRLLFGEAPERESGPVSSRSGIRIRGAWLGSGWVDGGVNVVRIGGPAEERCPPVGRDGFPAIWVGFVRGGSGGPDHSGSGRRESGCHWRDRNAEPKNEDFERCERLGLKQSFEVGGG
jgi:hypothetical protein